MYEYVFNLLLVLFCLGFVVYQFELRAKYKSNKPCPAELHTKPWSIL